MKRVAFFLALAAGIVAVVLLTISMTEDDVRRDRLEGGAQESRERDGGSDSEGGAASEPTPDKTKGGVDDDPNRVAGPDLKIRGIVMLNGKPAAGATVRLLRAHPLDGGLRRGLADPRRGMVGFPPLAETKADQEGRFELSTGRRRRLIVGAFAAGTGVTRIELRAPATGDPTEVRIELTAGFGVVGIVVDENGEPVEGVELVSSSGGTSGAYPFLQQATSGADGRFRFGQLGQGYHTIMTQREGYPTLSRRFQVPQTREIQIQLVKGGTVSGVLSEKDGSPITSARIVIQSGDSAGTARGAAEATTDAQGAFEIALAVPGPISIATIVHADWGRRESSRGDVVLPQKAIEAGKVLEWNIELESGVRARGVIVEKETGKPVANARLAFLRSHSTARSRQVVRWAVADADGRFDVDHLSEGSYAIDVKAANHARTIARWSQPNQQVVNDFFSDGVNDPDPLRIEVGVSARVEGHVLGLEQRSSNIWVRMPAIGNTSNNRADATGFFVFEHAPVGKPLKITSASPKAESEEFSIEKGEVKTVDLDIDSKPQFTGIVIGSDGNPIAGAYVKAAMENQARSQLRNILQQGGWGTSRTDAEGKFSIHLQGWQLQQMASQKWALAAVSYQFPLQIKRDVRAPKDGESQFVRFTLEGGGKISGTVEVEGKGPAPNVRVAVSPKHLDPKERAKDARQRRYGYTDLVGRFEVEGIGSGEWNVSTSTPDGQSESQTAVAGDSDVRLKIQATLAIAGLVVDEDGKPVPRARVYAALPGTDKKQRKRAQADQSGRFRIAHLEPGDYILEAAPTKNQNGYWNGQVSKGFKATTTRAYPAGTDDIVIKVEPGSRIAGRIVSPDGKPVGAAGVMALKAVAANSSPRRGRQQNQPTTFSNGSGEFELFGVEDGEYTIVVVGNGYLIEQLSATVGQHNLVVNLKEGGTIEGKILAPDGSPVANQWINLQPKDPEVTRKFQNIWARGQQGWNAIGGWQSQAATTKSDGTFEVRGLFPGKYGMTLNTPRGVMPKMELHTGAGRVTIRLRPALTIEGRVVTEAGGAPDTGGSPIWVNAQGVSSWVQADADGNFELKGVPEGTIKVSVWAGNKYMQTTEEVQAGADNVRIVLKERPTPVQPPRPR